MIRLRDIDLQREIRLERHSGVVDRKHDRQGVRRMYSAKIESRESSVTVAVYQGDSAEEEWRRDVAQYMAVWHPNIVQIFGTAKSGNIHATILHDELIPLGDFLCLHLDSPFATVYIHLHIIAATRAVGDYLDLTLGHRQSAYFIGGSPLRLCADIVPGGLFPAIIEYSQPNENFSRRGLEYLSTPNMKTTVIESLILEEYHQVCSFVLRKI
ncbi:hypothetical protein DFH08DRAFT_243759 [Mycena albidolilacea]|uniref:Protein kinase domain-containing protein n=1 Tax=Mycena albidolilacea TaxID=1033008 RepID=A0AAD7ENY8_9AGAR|nr:hypothetical protein DFH08DRAFT_243759 [Mycena albidolilacea]